VRWTPAFFALTIALQGAGAQIVRGVVTERISGLPLPGVLVTIASVPDSLRPGGLRHTLTNARGEFGVRLSSGGRFVVSAKRIGVARRTTEAFALGVGATRRVDLTLEAFEHRLPVVNVVDTYLCFRRNDQRRQIIALWDEVRTALLASEVSREEQLLTGWLSRYVRSLEPRSLRILDDRRSVAEGRFERPIRSISGDSLAKVGYWRKQDADTLVFYGPDEEALLSTAFRAGHCFELVTGGRDRRGLVGLAFRPRTPNVLGGIGGTIWIDAGNFELRFIEFRYTNLITIPANQHIGGQVHYLKHESGAWLVRRWFVRMPLFPSITPVEVARAGIVSRPRPSVYRLIEEGGGLFTPGLRTWERPGTIQGAVMDSMGRKPLRGTVVSLSGTPFSVEVDSLGAFRFDRIPPGAYTLLAAHSVYSDLGQLVDDEPLTLAAGQNYRTSLKAINTTELLAVLCDGKTVKPTDATLRVVATHADSGGTLTGLQLWLRWPDPTQKEPIDRTAPRSISSGDGRAGEVKTLGVHSMTDGNGAVTFCGVPSGTRLELVMPTSEDDPDIPSGARVVRVTGFVLNPGDVTSRTVTLRPPR
jgi:hypothetical protein